MQVQSLGWEDSPAGGNGNPPQYSCLENPMDRGACWGCSLWDHKESDMTEQLTQLESLWTLESLQDLSAIE